MKSKLIYLLFTLMLTFCLNTLQAQTVKHIVVFKYKPTATPEQISRVAKAFGDLKGKIPTIISFESGINNSPENLNKGFTHIFLLTFADVKDRDAYLIHPDHKKFVELLGKENVLEEPFVVDFAVGKN